MKITLKNIIKGILPFGLIYLWERKGRSVKEEYLDYQFILFDGNKTNCYGLCGEDILLYLFMKYPADYKGFYVDIGAFHPHLFSNTKHFYDKGWNGINIDANPDSINKFVKERSRDINILCGVSNEYNELDYYSFGSVAEINTFDKKQAYISEKAHNYKIKEIKKVKVEPINAILDKHCQPGQKIDFITIDVEGFEMKILQSLNFEKYAPDYFLVEDLENIKKNIDIFKTTTLYNFLKDKGYEAVGKVYLTYLFQKQ